MGAFLREMRRNKGYYSLLVPAIVLTVIFGYCTIPWMVIAFEKYNYKTGIASQWVGLQNFVFFFQSAKAWEVTYNTLFLNSLYMVFDTVFAILMALLINEIRSRLLARTMQSIMLFPHFLSWVIVSYVLYAFLNYKLGFINQSIATFGGEPVKWYNRAQAWPMIFTITHTLKSTGYNSIVYLAAITGIDEGIYEAAMIDGASRRQCMTYITLPLLIPTICILTLLGIGRIFNADFGMYYAMIRDNALLLKTTDVIDTYVFRLLRTTGNPSMSMATGIYQSVMGFVMVFGTNWLSRRFYPEGALF